MVSHLVNDLKQFDEELSREHYLNSSGQKDELESSKIFRKFKHLFSKEHITESHKNISTREGKLLYDAFVGNFIGNQLKGISDKASSYESSATVECNGQTIPFRNVSALLMNEDIREKRKMLYESTKPVKKKLTSFEKRSWKKMYELITELANKSLCTGYKLSNTTSRSFQAFRYSPSEGHLAVWRSWYRQDHVGKGSSQ